MTTRRVRRTYPQYVDRNIKVPDWAKVPFKCEGLPPPAILTMAKAKEFAREAWVNRVGARETTEKEVQRFVFSFRWRWHGDEIHRYQVLAQWGYEFASNAEKQSEIAARRARRLAAIRDKTRPDIVLSPLLAGTPRQGPEAENSDRLSFTPGLATPAASQTGRFILLDQRQPKNRSSRATAARVVKSAGA